MTSGLPDYTRHWVVDIRVSPSVNFLGSIAESKTKLDVTEQITSAGDMCEIVPTSGKKVGLLIIVGSSQYISDTFKVQAYQSGSWVDIIKPVYGQMFLAFPCWQPTMDDGDGSTGRVKMVTAGDGPWSGYILYYEYE